MDPTPILVCGLLSVDMVFQVPAIPTEPIKHRASDVSMICGGGGCYASLAINRLGGQAHLFSRLGNDEFGQYVLAALNKNGIDGTNIRVSDSYRTPVSSIAVDPQGERQIVNFRQHCDSLETKPLQFDSPVQGVLVDTRWSAGSIHALNIAKAQQLPGVVDAEAPVCLETMRSATHIAFSKQGLTDYAPNTPVLDALRRAATAFSAWVCVTDGENGTHVLCNHTLQTIPAPKVKVVDTLGAGDVWHGAFTTELARGTDEINAVAFANVAAALKCTGTDGGYAAPHRREVTELLQSFST